MVNITLVGCGHYARDIVYPIYAKHPMCKVKATISPNSILPGQGAMCFKSVKEWVDVFGAPNEDDVFDMCVFAGVLNPLIQELCDVGARKFILPKPIADIVTRLMGTHYLKAKYGADMLVASQYWYDSELYSTIKSNHDILMILMEQEFDNKKYNAFNSFLPHALQICHSAGCGLGARPVISADFKSIRILGGNLRPVEIGIRSDSKESRRVVSAGRAFVDLLNRHTPFENMIDSMIRHFAGEAVPVLDVYGYRPIAIQYLELVRQAGYYI